MDIYRGCSGNRSGDYTAWLSSDRSIGAMVSFSGMVGTAEKENQGAKMSFPKNATIATWNVSLNCECPKCKEYIDLMEAPNFWDGHSSLEISEHGTETSKGVEVVCPECQHEFTVDCEY